MGLGFSSVELANPSFDLYIFPKTSIKTVKKECKDLVNRSIKDDSIIQSIKIRYSDSHYIYKKLKGINSYSDILLEMKKLNINVYKYLFAMEYLK